MVAAPDKTKAKNNREKSEQYVILYPSKEAEAIDPVADAKPEKKRKSNKRQKTPQESSSNNVTPKVKPAKKRKDKKRQEKTNSVEPKRNKKKTKEPRTPEVTQKLTIDDDVKPEIAKVRPTGKKNKPKRSSQAVSEDVDNRKKETSTGKGAPVNPRVKKDKKEKTKDETLEKTAENLLKKRIPAHSLIETATDKYTILRRLGSGGFGDVYECVRKSDNKVFAVKIGYPAKDPEQRLKKEYEIYRDIAKSKLFNPISTEHLMDVIDYGECAQIVHFMFMPLCGQSLDVVFKDQLPSLNTALSLSYQCFVAIKNFHSLRRIHRDIKPANFTLGLPPKDNTIYLIDFGMAVLYVEDPEKMPETSIYDFIGTVRYASRTTHQGLPQTRKDDLESWLFVVMEFFKKNILPWTRTKDDKEIENLKDKLFKELPDDVFNSVPSCFREIAKIVDGTSKFAPPDYRQIEMGLSNLTDLSRPFEFIARNKPQGSDHCSESLN